MPFVEPGKKIKRSNSYQESLNLLNDVLQSQQLENQASQMVYQNYTQEDIGIPEKDEDLSDFKPNPDTMPWTTEARQRIQMETQGITTEQRIAQERFKEYQKAVEENVITPEEADGYNYLMYQKFLREEEAKSKASSNSQGPTSGTNVVNGIDVDLALRSIASYESGSNGESKVGMPTSLKGSASGTFQMSDQAKLDVYQKNYKEQYKSFEDFKHAFNTNPEVEYNAVKALMTEHAKNYGEYALGAWYYPEYARRVKNGDMSVMNIIPRPDYGNKLTWGQDFNNKRTKYYELLEKQNLSRQQVGSNEPQNGMTGPPPPQSFENFNPIVKSSSVNHKNLDNRLKNWYSRQESKHDGLMITSANDSKEHEPGSRHYQNRAIDIRTEHGNRAGQNLKNEVMQNGTFIYNGKRGPVYMYDGVRVLIENNHLHVSI